MVVETCRKMANGGIFDQLGGGFHRYSVDAIWLVPHFEKMLYDNAQLVRIFLHVFQVTGDQFFREVAEQTLDYVMREMLDESGGFYSAQDADSEGVEGKFFVWTVEEVIELLGEKDGQIFARHYDVTQSGNFEGKNILNVKTPLKETAKALGLTTDQINTSLDRGRAALFGKREQRIKPFRDEKVLTAWNGLMLAAFADAAAVLGDQRYLAVATKNADFLMNELTESGRLFRTWKDGTAKLGGYLEDYANMADGLFELFQVSGDEKYLAESRRIAEIMIDEFWDEEQGGFYFTGKNHENLLVRSKDYNDNATPSGNSAATDVLSKLAKIFGEERFTRFAMTGLRITAAQAGRYPGAFGRALSVMEFNQASVREVVIVGERGSELEEFMNVHYLPDTVVYFSDGQSSMETPLLAGREMINGKPTVYVCQDYSCRRPVTSVGELAELLR
jgi:uncharacterized protein YyaL (SSP411 family)